MHCGVEPWTHRAVPMQGDDAAVQRVVIQDGQRAQLVAVAIENEDLRVLSHEQQELSIRRPLHKAQLQAQLFPPEAVAVHGAHDDRAVLVDDRDLAPVRGPLHALHHGLVAVVDHLFVPGALVHDPHDDESALVAGGELAVDRVPRHAHDASVMALEGLVHGEVGRGGHSLEQGIGSRGSLELQDFQQAILSSAGDVPLTRTLGAQQGNIRHRQQTLTWSLFHEMQFKRTWLGMAICLLAVTVTVTVTVTVSQ
eukprot:scaffold2352_cov153-Ochromonas_danica.AAC.7